MFTAVLPGFDRAVAWAVPSPTYNCVLWQGIPMLANHRSWMAWLGKRWSALLSRPGTPNTFKRTFSLPLWSCVIHQVSSFRLSLISSCRLGFVVFILSVLMRVCFRLVKPDWLYGVFQPVVNENTLRFYVTPLQFLYFIVYHFVLRLPP